MDLKKVLIDRQYFYGTKLLFCGQWSKGSFYIEQLTGTMASCNASVKQLESPASRYFFERLHFCSNGHNTHRIATFV